MVKTEKYECPLCTERLSAGGYTAEFAPETGATCFRLFHEPTGSEILRFPKSEEDRQTNVFLFGNPILFPPNRIRGGKFVFVGREYVFPVNEPKTGCFIHGNLLNLAFSVAKKTGNEIVFEYFAKSREYLGFPHDFGVKGRYKLGKNGLEEFTTITNDGADEMPVMLAYHTTFDLKFGGDENAVTLEVPVSEEYLRDENFLPTGEKASERPRDRELKDGTFKPAARPFSAFYGADGKPLVALLKNEKSGVCVRYSCDDSFGFRMLYRGDGDDFVALEPQTCVTDCFHFGEDPKELGLIALKGGSSKTFHTKIEASV